MTAPPYANPPPFVWTKTDDPRSNWQLEGGKSAKSLGATVIELQAAVTRLREDRDLYRSRFRELKVRNAELEQKVKTLSGKQRESMDHDRTSPFGLGAKLDESLTFTSNSRNMKEQTSQAQKQRTPLRTESFDTSNCRYDESKDTSDKASKAANSRPQTYPCLYPDCTYAPERQYDLDRHMKKHFPSRADDIFDCPGRGCTRVGRNGFNRKDHMNEHLVEYHGWDPKTRRSRQTEPR